MSTDDGDDFNSKVAVLLIGVGSAAFVVTIYHCISMRWCNRANPPERDPTMEIIGPSSMEHSAAQLIPAYKYQKGVGLMGDDEEGGTCAICLSEFEEGEELKTLPECLHSYHEECIDMWLYSHSNCPMCRTGAISPPQIVLRSLELSSDGLLLDPDHNVSMLQNVLVHQQTI